MKLIFISTLSALATVVMGYSGDMTYYAPGLGSCGAVSSASQNVVALSTAMMANGPNPNNNPKCFKHITITYGGKNFDATIVDTCVGCAYQDIDLSPSLFKKVAPNGDGRVKNVSWKFV